MIATMGRLAVKDFVHDRKLFFCFIMALAAVLAPIEVLLGLKYGIVDTMRRQLIENPRTREIANGANRNFDDAFIARLRNRPDVVFVIPRTRSLAATINLQRAGSSTVVTADLIPTAAGDPLLAGKRIPGKPDEVLLSTSAAEKLGLEPGDEVTGTVARSIGDERQAVHLPLRVTDVSGSFPRDGAFATLGFLEALEDYRDNIAVPQFGWAGKPAPSARSYAGFRLYTRRLEEVAPLAASLRAADIDVRDHEDEISFVLLLDRNLSVMFAIVAGIGSLGYMVSLGASLWANVERKRKSFGILSLIGVRRRSMVAFPLLQACLVALIGIAIADGVFLAAAAAINTYFSAGIVGDTQICRLPPAYLALTAAATVLAALAASGAAGWRSARVQPAESLRDV